MTTEELLQSMTREQLDALLEALALPEEDAQDEDDKEDFCFSIVVSLSCLIEDALKRIESDATN